MCNMYLKSSIQYLHNSLYLMGVVVNCGYIGSVVDLFILFSDIMQLGELINYS